MLYFTGSFFCATIMFLVLYLVAYHAPRRAEMERVRDFVRASKDGRLNPGDEVVANSATPVIWMGFVGDNEKISLIEIPNRNRGGGEDNRQLHIMTSMLSLLKSVRLS